MTNYTPGADWPTLAKHEHRESIPAERLNPQALGLPDNPVRLPAHALACRSCGVAVHTDTNGVLEVIHAESLGRVIEGPAAATLAANNQRPIPIDFAVCPECRDREEQSRALLADHPKLALRLGQTAPLQVALAMDALAAIGQNPGSLRGVDGDGDRALAASIKRLVLGGNGARWISRFVSMMAIDADLKTCAPYPWAHVRLGLRRDIRTDFAALLAERVAASGSPVALPAPEPSLGADSTLVPVPGGCLFCGVGSVTLPAAQVQRLGGRQAAQGITWTARTATPESLGARRSPARLTGHVCPSCSEAIEATGSNGQTAMLRAFSNFLRSVGRDADAERLRGYEVRLVGWGAHWYSSARLGAPTPPPNRTPWSHTELPPI